MKTFRLKLSITLVFICFVTFGGFAQIAEKIETTTENQLLGLGTYHTLKSGILNEDRPVIIYLPNEYKENSENYPVLYLLDGLGNIKHQVGTMELLTESGIIPPMIIVAIESLNRSRDLTPSKAGGDVYGGVSGAGIPQSGGAPKFLDFMEKELMPYVETNFRTHPFRLLEGHSFGGLFTTFAMMERPSLFDTYIVQSPALWWNKEEMTQKAKGFFSKDASFNKTAYFGIGGGDGWGMRQELIHFVDVLKQSAPDDFKWMHEEIGDEGHDDARLLLNYYGLKFVFNNLKLSKETLTNFTEEGFLKDELTLKKKYGNKVRRPAGDYFDLFSKLMDEGKDLEAITVLKRAAEAYPKYAVLQKTLAQLYEKTNQIGEAIAALEQAILISKKLRLGQEDGYQMEIDRLKKTK